MAQPPIPARDNQAFSAMTLEQKVQELADREEIRQLLALYAQRVNHGHGVADLFTQDGVWTMRAPGSDAVREIRGGEALKVAFSSFTTDPAGAPMIHNVVIAVDGDRAEAMDMNDLWSSANGKRHHAWGNYQDTFRKVDGRWLFSARHMTFTEWHDVAEAQ